MLVQLSMDPKTPWKKGQSVHSSNSQMSRKLVDPRHVNCVGEKESQQQSTAFHIRKQRTNLEQGHSASQGCPQCWVRRQLRWVQVRTKLPRGGALFPTSEIFNVSSLTILSVASVSALSSNLACVIRTVQLKLPRIENDATRPSFRATTSHH